MKSIKPGRGPSGMALAGSLAAVIFGLFWTGAAVMMTKGSPFGVVGSIFPLFGVIFIIIGVVQAVYHYKNARGKDRFSLLDITDDGEEGDPSDRWIKNDMVADTEDGEKTGGPERFRFCPYCGSDLEDRFTYCPGCGKRLDA
ncbi:MAG: zinc ribbon domain-containing protein [Clostridia bacterium]|nr:zinc ribbon domain-containing protein [Clostridia bacterium]